MIAASRHVLWSPAEWCISRISCCADSLSPPIVSTANGRCTARMASAASLYLSTLPRAASFVSLAGPEADSLKERRERQQHDTALGSE